MSKSFILVVEDEPSIAEVVSLYLKRAGFPVKVVADGQAALDEMSRQVPDLLILDIMLPKVDGFTIIRWLRDRSDAPVIILTSRRDEIDRIAGLEMGADDYVVKPFSPQELVSRVRAVLRRTQSSIQSDAESPLVFDDLRIEPQNHSVLLGDKGLTLTVKEFDMLYWLARHPRQVFSRDQLLEAVWGVSDYIDPSTVTVHIRRLREKIEVDSSNPSRLVTVWGVGYKFEP
jgi:DNA-binding response OmpR family regulator